MTPFTRVTLSGLLLLTCASAQQGHFEGKLMLPDREIVLVVDLDKNAEQAWIGSISITPGPSGLSLKSIKVTGETVSFVIDGIPGAPEFEGKWDKEGKTVKGNATANGNSVQFEMTHKGDAKVVVPKASSPLPKDMEGDWEGSLNAGGNVLRLLLTLKTGPDGKAVATVVSVDQGNASIPVNTLTLEGDSLSLDIKAVGGTYKSKLNAEKTELTGEWTQGGNPLPLNFKRKAVEEKK